MSAPSWTNPTLPSTQVVNCVADGDSITYGQTWTDAQHTYPYLLGAQAGAWLGGSGSSITNFGHSGDTIANMIARGATTDAAIVGGKKNVLLWMGGTNDLVAPSDVGTFLSQAKTYLAARRAAGWDAIFWWTLMDALPRAPNFDADRQLFNSYIRRWSADFGCFGVIDIGATTAMGQSGPQQAANFGADGEHPNATGNQIMANLAQTALNRYARYIS